MQAFHKHEHTRQSELITVKPHITLSRQLGAISLIYEMISKHVQQRRINTCSSIYLLTTRFQKINCRL